MYKKSSDNRENLQFDMFKPLLLNIVNPIHELVILADSIDWVSLEDDLSLYFSKKGRCGCNLRLMIGLSYLKHTFDLSDEALLEYWVENPYWQYFCGEKYFTHEFPIDSSSLTNWRKRIGEPGHERILESTISTGKKLGFIKAKDLEEVISDTTVQEKNVHFPTDSRLKSKARSTIVKLAFEHGINIRQSYERLSKKSLLKESGYSKASQFKRAKQERKNQHNWLGRVIRDVEKSNIPKDGRLLEALSLGKRLYNQKLKDKNKLYSLSEPDVECISKGKAHKKYEFGCKVAVVTSLKKNWVLGIKALHGNPYDGHTLADILEQTERITKKEVKLVALDLGYRKHDYTGSAKVHIVSRFRKKVDRKTKKIWKRRSAIEPVIGHLKSDNRLNRNRLKGKLGDKVNAIAAGIGFNMKKLLKAIFWLYSIFESINLTLTLNTDNKKRIAFCF